MRILLVVETSSGGSGGHVIELAELLHGLGHDVHLVYSPLRMDKQFAEALQNHREIKCYPISIRRSIHPADILSTLKIRRYISQNGGFDVVHGHSSKGGALARLAAMFHPCARVYTPHAFITMNPTLSRSGLFLYGFIERLLGNFVTDAIIAVSEDERQHGIGLGLSASKIVFVQPGVRQIEAPEPAAVRARLGLAEDDFCVGWVGRFAPQKAPERLIQAIAQIAPDYPKLKLIVLGDGPLEPEVRALSVELGIDDRILWLKDLPGQEIMPSFDVFVLTSRYEGMPRVILEALSAGVPVVAMQAGGVNSAVRSGVEGFVVPPGDLAAFVDRLRLLTTDRDLRCRMKVTARKSAERFSLETMARRNLEIYRTALSNRLGKVDHSKN
jgi:glycosyltransferase involved in cell wall biosynthesis